MARVAGSTRVVFAALAGNLAISVTKFVAFALTASTAMLTEAIHSLVDTGDQLLLLLGQRRAARPASESHPFGYGLEAYFWSFVVALMIFLAGGAVSVWEGFERLHHPEPISRPWVNFIVLAASAVFEGLSFREAYREYRRVAAGSGIRLFQFLRISKDPSVFGTLLEDGAALAGLAMAALGVGCSALLGLTWADGAASVGIGFLLIGVAIFLANETRSLIAGEGAAPGIEDRIREAADAGCEHSRIGKLATLQLGPQAILVVAFIRFPSALSQEAWRAEAERIAASCKGAEPRVLDVVFKPD